MQKRVCFMVLVVLAAALLVGCGSSSKTSSASTNASAATATTGAKAAKGPNASHFKRAGARVNSPAFKAALTKFATCLRQNGVNMSAPNTSGNGPIFSAKGIDTSSAQFRTAERKCSATLRAGLGTAKTRRTAGSPGSVGQTKTSPAPKLKVKVPPKLTHALQQFTACMREHGVTTYPEPEGASFNLSHTHINTKSAQYKAAEKKCNPILNAAF
jgi:hypothetical protein